MDDNNHEANRKLLARFESGAFLVDLIDEGHGLIVVTIGYRESADRLRHVITLCGCHAEDFLDAVTDGVNRLRELHDDD